MRIERPYGLTRLGLMAALAIGGFSLPAAAQDAPAGAGAGKPPATQPAGGGERREGREGRGGGGQRGNPQVMLERLKTRVNALTLTDEQKTKIDAIFAKAEPEAQALQAELQSAEPRERMQKSQEYFGKVRQEITAVLDDTQKQALREQGGGRGDGGGRGPATQPADRIAPLLERMQGNLDQLDLSDDQKKQVDELMTETKSKLEAAAQQASAQPGQGGQGGGGRGRGGPFRAIMRDTQERLNQILTVEQQEKLRELMPQGGRGGPGGRGGGGRRGGGRGGNNGADGGAAPEPL